MIGGAVSGAGGRALGRHLADVRGVNDEARPGAARGLMAEDTEGRIRELTDMAQASGHKAALRHAFASPAPGQPWGPEERAAYWRNYERMMGLEGCPFAEDRHEKPGEHDRPGHEHRVYLALTPRGTLVRIGHDYARQEAVSRIAEHDAGFPLTKGKHNVRAAHLLRAFGRADVAEAMAIAGLLDGTRAVAALTPEQRHQQDRTKVAKADVAAAVASAWSTSDSPQALAAALRDAGLVLARGDRAAVVVDGTGNTHGLGKMLAMAARATGEKAPKAADVEARLADAELPSLDAARAIQRDDRTPAAPAPERPPEAVPESPAPPTGGGEPVAAPVSPASRDAPAQPETDMPTPSRDGASLPAAARAPSPGKAGGGGGGGGAGAAQDGPAVPPSLDAGEGPGEPPGPGAGPDEMARYREKLAAHQARRESQWAALMRFLAAEAEKKNKKGSSPSGGGGHDVDEKGLREAISGFLRGIQDAAERREKTAAVNAALSAFRAGPACDHEGPGEGLAAGRAGAPARDEPRGPSGSPGAGLVGGDAPAEGGRGAAGVDGGHERLRADTREPARDEAGNRCPATRLEAALERARLDASASIADPSALRAEMALHRPDPLAGLEGKERRARLQELNDDLYRAFQGEQRQDFAEAVARERMRAHPLAQALRDGRRHIPADERAAAWATIREARQRLVDELRAEQRANGKAAFRHFLEARSHTDPGAAAVLAELRRADENRARIAAELARGAARVAELRALEPQGERDPERAARAAKTALYEPMKAAQERTRAAEEELAATPLPGGFWPFNRGAARRHAAALAAVEAARRDEEDATPHYLDIDSAEAKARNAAAHNERAHAAWRAGPGAEADRLDRGLARIRDALSARDFRMRDALLSPEGGGLERALAEVRRRETEEQRRREIEAAREQRRGNVYGFPARGGDAMPAPRMR